MSWEEKDIEIMEKIKENTENLEIPKTLSPENMMKRLENEQSKKKNIKKTFIKVMAAAACMGAVAVSLWQLQGNDVVLKKIIPDLVKNKKEKALSSSDYASIYEKLKKVQPEIKYGDMGKEENYLDGAVNESGVMVENDADSYKGQTTGSTENNVSDTNVQVEGIDEADVVKNDREYIYALDMTGNKVSIISMKKEKKVSDIQIIDEYLSFYNADMYVSNDTLVVVGTYVENETQIYIYDISDREEPVQVSSISQQGSYYTSRLAGDYLYIMSDSYIRGKLSEDNCVPRLDGEQIEADCVVISENVTSLEYEFIISIDLKSPETVIDKKAITKDSNGYIYMSAENIYVTNYSFKDDSTFITKVGYKDGRFSETVEGSIDGRLYGQFAMDEYNGYLRLVSTDWTEGKYRDDQTNIVYVLDGSLQEIGKITGIADGESIYSARFMGDIGYFVTYYQTDPLFKVDFSDPSNPVILGQLEITGYSDYLHPWGDDKLMGLGYVDNELKLSMFQLNDNGDMSEITRKIFRDCYQSPASQNHKALMISPETNLIGFTTVTGDMYSDNFDESLVYEVYSYIDGEFVCRLSEKILQTDWGNYDSYGSEIYENAYNTRGVYADGKLYIVIPGDKVSIYNIDTMESLGEIKID
ncbi:MAG: beta-propeller domain-containing protein [Lachnospiraceae bacterium]|nr:beta-propeller domain-containing protein [Lachnospiraceae bacterium]